MGSFDLKARRVLCLWLLPAIVGNGFLVFDFAFFVLVAYPPMKTQGFLENSATVHACAAQQLVGWQFLK